LNTAEVDVAGTVTFSTAAGFTQNSGGDLKSADATASAVSITANTGGGASSVSLQNIATGSGGTITVNARAGSLNQAAGKLSTGTGTIVLETSGSGATTQASSASLSTKQLLLQGTGTGSFTLASTTNSANVLAASTNAQLIYTNSKALQVGTVNGMPGIDTGGNNVTLTTTAGTLTIGDGGGQGIKATGAIADLNAFGAMENKNSTITSGMARLHGMGAGDFTLDQANAVGMLAAGVTGKLKLMDTISLTVGQVKDMVGIVTGGHNLTLMTNMDFVINDDTLPKPQTSEVDTGIAPITVMAGMAANPGTVRIDVKGQINSTAATGATITGAQGLTVANTFMIRPGSGKSTVINLVGNAVAPNCPDTLRFQNLGVGEANINAIQFFKDPNPCNGKFEFNNDPARLVVYKNIGKLLGETLQVTSVQTSNTIREIQVNGTIEGIALTGVSQITNITVNQFLLSPALTPTAFTAARVTFADVTGNGFQDLIIASGPGEKPLVTVIDGRSLTGTGGGVLTNKDLIGQFYAFDANPKTAGFFMGGINIAAGKLDKNSNQAYIVASMDTGGSPIVRVFKFDPNDPNNPNKFLRVKEFTAYDTRFTGGVRVAVGDADANGQRIIVTAPGPGAALPVKVFTVTANGPNVAITVKQSLFPYEPNYSEGIYVAVSNLSLATPTNDILTGPEAGEPVLHIFKGDKPMYSTMDEISFLAFRHGTGTQLATGKTVTFNANSPIFGVSSVVFSSTFINGSREISVATGIGNNAFEVTGVIPNPLLDLTDPNLKNRSDKFVKAPPARRLLFAKKRSARGVNLA
jgi:hypothetical protein